MQAGLHALSLLLVTLMGFAAHGSSLCTVRAVAEVFQHRRFEMLASFGRAALWTAAVSGALMSLLALPRPVVLVREPLGWALSGGFLFGVGAAVNGGCSLSMLQRLADGDRSMLLTLIAFCAGVLVWTAIDAAGVATVLAPLSSPWTVAQEWASAALLLLVIWCVVELQSMIRAAPADVAWRSRLLAPSYPLPVAAAKAARGSSGARTDGRRAVRRHALAAG